MEIPSSKKDGCQRKTQGNLLATWCEPDLTDPYKALCLVCNKGFSCSDSGKAKIIAHAKGAKHIVLQKNKKGQKVLGVVQGSKSCASTSTSTSKTTNTLVAFRDESLTEKICKAEFIDEHLKAEDLHGLLPFISCCLHVAHNAFRYGLKEYGSEVGYLVLLWQVAKL